MSATRKQRRLAKMPTAPTVKTTSFGAIATGFVLGGTLGWVIENVLYGSRNSNAFGKLPVPFLPVYAVGTATVVATAPAMQNLPMIVRGIAYGSELTAVELAACKLDRTEGSASWDYGNGRCVDWRHAVLWGALGLVVEQAVVFVSASQ